ncbi:MAG: extracellular solute-binding protein [Eubacteriales bacterium]
MKISLRVTAIFLSLVLSAIPLYSCTADTTPASDTTAPITASTEAVPTTEERLYPDLPEADFEGYEFTFLSRTIKGWNDAFVQHDLYAEMETGDVINDAVYKRNLKIEEKYHVKIKEISKELSTNEFVKTLKTAVSSGSGDFDAILPQPASTTSLLLEGLFLDLNTIPHLGLDQPWWNQNANESLSINDTLYYTFSDLSIMDNNACAGVLFNKQMLVDYGLQDPYQLVRDGKWTYDKVHEMSKAVVKDLNGDGAMKNADDQFGFLGQADVMLAFYNGSGERFATKDDNGLPVIAFGSDRGMAVIDSIMNLMYDNETTVNAHKTNDSVNNNITIFSDGRALFFWENMYIATALRSLEIDFGILPTPKFDEAQEKYYTALSNHGSTGIAVPNLDKDLDRTGIILEALTAESMYTLEPAYYDIMLVSKYSRDEESKEMLDIIFDNIIVDIGIFYDFGGFASTFMQLSIKDNRDVVSVFEKNQPKIQTSIDKFIEGFGNIGQ